MLVFLGALWSWVLFNRLWQGSLGQESQEARRHLEAEGLELLEPGVRARLVYVGELGGQPARVVLRGGVLGARTWARIRGGVVRAPLIRTVADAQALLGGAQATTSAPEGAEAETTVGPDA